MGSTWVVQGREGCTGRVSIVEAVEGAVVVEVGPSRRRDKREREISE